MNNLVSSSHSMAEHLYRTAAGPSGAQANQQQGSGASGSSKENVVDAEYEEKK